MKSTTTWIGLGLALASSLPRAFFNLAFSIAVYISATRKRAAGGTLLFFGPFLWALVTLFNGVIGAAIYWLANESAIARPTPGHPSVTTTPPPKFPSSN